jgi:hypothetical protein
VLADGFHSAAAKHDRYDVDSNGVVTVTTSPRPRPPAPR